MTTRKVIAFSATAVVVTLLAIATRDRIWIRQTRSPIAAGTEVWRSTTGWYFVRSSHGEYVVCPRSSYVGVPNGAEIYQIGRVAITKHGPVPSVRLPSAKMPRDPQLFIGHGVLAFTATDGTRVNILVGAVPSRPAN